MQTKTDLQNENARLKAEIEALGKDNEKYRCQANDANDRIKALKGIIAGLEIDLATVRGYAMRIVQEDNASVIEPMRDQPSAEQVYREVTSDLLGSKHQQRPAFEVPCNNGGPAYAEVAEVDRLYGASGRISRSTKWFEI